MRVTSVLMRGCSKLIPCVLQLFTEKGGGEASR